MPRKAVLPGPEELEEMLRRGETRTSISELYGVTRGAVSLALLRAGKEPGQVRHDTLIPWHVRAAHLLQYSVKMLRLEGRLRAGLPVSDKDAGRLRTWKKDLNENDDSVIMYFPEHDCPYCEGQGGFHPVRRADAIAKFGQPDRGFDTELIFVTKQQGAEIRKRRTRGN